VAALLLVESGGIVMMACPLKNCHSSRSRETTMNLGDLFLLRGESVVSYAVDEADPRAAPALKIHRQRCGGPRDDSISGVCIKQIIEILWSAVTLNLL
jgi:hypothetical protein